jgi:methylmalonyl-CoA mutase cobalamin-binding subunit
MPNFNLSIRVVARRTGLSPYVIRIWERRYSAVVPARTPTNRRRYSDVDVQRLTLLRRATEAGHSIGAVAGLRTDRLMDLLGCDGEVGTGDGLAGLASNGTQDYVGASVEAVRRLDAAVLEGVLQRASLELGCQGLLQRVVGPLAHELGERWERGEITAAQEHFASATVRSWLGGLVRPFALAPNAPTLVVATPVGQLHELGAVMAAAAAAGHGWRVAYLGVSLPAAEIAGAVLRCGAAAVALSLVYPSNDPDLPSELERLGRFLPAGLPVVAGGRAAGAYRVALERIGGQVVADLSEFQVWLDEARSRGHGGGVAMAHGTPPARGAGEGVDGRANVVPIRGRWGEKSRETEAPRV